MHFNKRKDTYEKKSSTLFECRVESKPGTTFLSVSGQDTTIVVPITIDFPHHHFETYVNVRLRQL